MISKEDFLGKIRTEILLSQSLADEKKKKCILFIEIFLAFLGTMSCLYAFFYIRESNPFVALLIFAILCFCINMHVWRYFKEKQKKAFYPIALKLLDHLKNKKIAFSIRDITGLLEQTCLFHRFLMIHLNHLIDGSFKGKHFFIAELYTRDRHGTRIDIRDTLFGKRYFQGVCIDIPLDKKLSGYVFLVDKRRDFSFLGKNKLKVELNDTSFGKEVSAYSNDPENARILLTPDFINKMKMLKKCFQNKMVEISFFKKHAFIVIETKDGLFRPCLETKEAPNTRSYEEFYDRIKAIYDVVAAVKANDKDIKESDIQLDEKLYKKFVEGNRKRHAVRGFKKTFPVWLLLILFSFLCVPIEPGIFFAILFFTPLILLWPFLDA